MDILLFHTIMFLDNDMADMPLPSGRGVATLRHLPEKIRLFSDLCPPQAVHALQQPQIPGEPLP